MYIVPKGMSSRVVYNLEHYDRLLVYQFQSPLYVLFQLRLWPRRLNVILPPFAKLRRYGLFLFLGCSPPFQAVARMHATDFEWLVSELLLMIFQSYLPDES